MDSNVCDQALKSSILGTLGDIQHDAHMTVCYTDVQTLIRKLDFGKSAGPVASVLRLLSVLMISSLCYYLFLSHCFYLMDIYRPN